MYKHILVPVNGSDTGAPQHLSDAGATTPAASNEDGRCFVSTDVAALASHMNTCKQSQGRFFSLRSGGDVLRVLVSSRIVSTGAVLVAAGLALLLYLA
jgi:hypothetical protein